MKSLKITHKLAAAATVGVLSAASAPASATLQTFDNTAQNIAEASKNFANLISIVAYIGGTGLGVAGVFKLKQHVDNPGQVAMKDGLIRLGAGGGLLGLPFLTEAMTDAAGGGVGSGIQFAETDKVDKTGL